MNDAGLDQFNTFVQCLSLALIVLPICYFIYYWDRLKRGRIRFNGRWRIWYWLSCSCSRWYSPQAGKPSHPDFKTPVFFFALPVPGARVSLHPLGGLAWITFPTSSWLPTEPTAA